MAVRSGVNCSESQNNVEYLLNIIDGDLYKFLEINGLNGISSALRGCHWYQDVLRLRDSGCLDRLSAL